MEQADTFNRRPQLGAEGKFPQNNSWINLPKNFSLLENYAKDYFMKIIFVYT